MVLTADEKAAGIRVDPETGEKLRRGVLTRAELSAHLRRMEQRWRAWAFGPKPEGEWAMTGVGWIRTTGNAKRAK